jgi:hypothetical protein
MTASTCDNGNRDFSGVLSIHSGTCGDIECVFSDKERCIPSRVRVFGSQQISWNTTEGQRYFLLMYGDIGNATGSYNLRIERNLGTGTIVKDEPLEEDHPDEKKPSLCWPWRVNGESCIRGVICNSVDNNCQHERLNSLSHHIRSKNDSAVLKGRGPIFGLSHTKGLKWLEHIETMGFHKCEWESWIHST